MRKAETRVSIGAATMLCALALLASPLVTGQGGSDVDGDGVPDSSDNCLDYPNGPLAQHPQTPMCDAQEDADFDGYGNPCDLDHNNDGANGIDDGGAVYAAMVAVSTNPIYDNNCDGAVGMDDVGIQLGAQASGNLLPGPSGLACAGTVPCP